jgi:hypothetical protein
MNLNKIQSSNKFLINIIHRLSSVNPCIVEKEGTPRGVLSDEAGYP